LVPSDTDVEFMTREVLHELGEDILSLKHGIGVSGLPTQYPADFNSSRAE
jgi:hypothetical protein